jgi:hypothetical protein
LIRQHNDRSKYPVGTVCRVAINLRRTGESRPFIRGRTHGVPRLKFTEQTDGQPRAAQGKWELQSTNRFGDQPQSAVLPWMHYAVTLMFHTLHFSIGADRAIDASRFRVGVTVRLTTLRKEAIRNKANKRPGLQRGGAAESVRLPN